MLQTESAAHPGPQDQQDVARRSEEDQVGGRAGRHLLYCTTVHQPFPRWVTVGEISCWLIQVAVALLAEREKTNFFEMSSGN